LGVLSTSPRAGALALRLAFGSADPWHGDFHPVSSVPCLAHTPPLTGAVKRPVQRLVRQGSPLVVITLVLGPAPSQCDGQG
jgi:hypothetical protein